MHRMGVSYQDWRLMPRWMRDDFELRHQAYVKKTASELEGANLGKIIGVVVRKVLGF
jgi:hypothetical protein